MSNDQFKHQTISFVMKKLKSYKFKYYYKLQEDQVSFFLLLNKQLSLSLKQTNTSYYILMKLLSKHPINRLTSHLIQSNYVYNCKHMIQLMIIAQQIKVDYKLVDKLTGDYFNKQNIIKVQLIINSYFDAQIIQQQKLIINQIGYCFYVIQTILGKYNKFVQSLAECVEYLYLLNINHQILAVEDISVMAIVIIHSAYVILTANQKISSFVQVLIGLLEQKIDIKVISNFAKALFKGLNRSNQKNIEKQLKNGKQLNDSK